VAGQTQAVTGSSQELRFISAVRLVAGVAADESNDTMGELVFGSDLLLMTCPTGTSGGRSDQMLLSGCMRVVTNGTAPGFQHIVGHGGFAGELTDVFVTGKAEIGLAVGHELFRRALVTGLASIQYRCMDGAGEEFRVAGTVRAVARHAF
jgi:hypothetical protein